MTRRADYTLPDEDEAEQSAKAPDAQAYFGRQNSK